MERPADLFDRTQEWEALSNFIESTGPGLRIGVVTGRRRQGKSFLLRRVVAGAGGLYHQAQVLGRVQALARFSDDVAHHLGLPQGAVSFSDWETAFRTALGFPARGSAALARDGATTVVVIDELPYLLDHSPEIPSVLQELYDETQGSRDHPPARIIVCGSALSVMSELLSGSQPLRARAELDLRINAFDYRDTAAFWGITSPEIALRVDAVFGGTPGYRSLVQTPPPETVNDIPAWLGRSVLNPSHALFSETDYLLREDPRVRDRQVYHSILAAVAAGNHTQKAIGGAVGRDHNQLRFPLETLIRAGFIRDERDILTARQTLYSLADPIVRFEELITAPCRDLLEERDVEAAWAESESVFSAGILGPHFERVCAEWTRSRGRDRFDPDLGAVGTAIINDAKAGSQHQLDVVAIRRGRRPARKPPEVIVLGEAKSSNRSRTLSDLHRLDHIRTLLQSRRVPVRDAQLVLFGRSGFDDNLIQTAESRSDVHLITLADLYT